MLNTLLNTLLWMTLVVGAGTGCFGGGGAQGLPDAGDASMTDDASPDTAEDSAQGGQDTPPDTTAADVAADSERSDVDAPPDASPDTTATDVAEDTDPEDTRLEDTDPEDTDPEDTSTADSSMEDVPGDTEVDSGDAEVDSGDDVAPDTAPSMDEAPPTWEEGAEVEVVFVGRRSLRARWPVATDDRGVVAYEVTAGEEVARVEDTQAALSGFDPGASLTVAVRAEDAAGNVSEAIEAAVTLETLPPAPGEVAPEAVREGATFADRVAFLVEGDDPVQTGVAPGAWTPERVALVRGEVRGADGEPLAGATVVVHGRPELGQTESRPDGRFTLLVQGGGAVVVEIRAEGRLSAQRRVALGWNDTVTLGAVALRPVSEVATTWAGGAEALQTHEGPEVVDDDGRRRAAVLMHPGTRATLVMPDGTEEELETVTLRATEVTEGESGLAAMPGELPPASAYTYAVDLSVDEAEAVGAREVRFDRPVVLYVDNFLGFPVGDPVPAGAYDAADARWEAGPNGRIVAVVGVEGGLAQVDANGDGVADNVAPIGITEEERAWLAGAVEVGGSLWRVPLEHLTPWDCNWPFLPPPGVGPPWGSGPNGPRGDSCPNDRDTTCAPNGPEPSEDPCKRDNSIIACENQTLGEAIPVPDTGLTLHYESGRMPGDPRSHTITLPLLGAEVHASILGVAVQLEGPAGEVDEALAPEAGLTWRWAWDGLDEWGRVLVGFHRFRIRAGFEVQGVYTEPAEFEENGAAFDASFAVAGGESYERTSRETIMIWSPWTDLDLRSPRTGAWGESLGGWTLDAHHRFMDGISTLLRGDGTERRLDGLGVRLAHWFGRGRINGGVTPDVDRVGEVVDPLAVTFGAVTHLAALPSGELLVSAPDRVWAVSDGGRVRLVLGRSVLDGCVQARDGATAEEVCLSQVQAAVAGDDGSIYVRDQEGASGRVLRVHPDGETLSRVAGGSGGAAPVSGALARDALLDPVGGLAVGPDGALYVSEYGDDRVWMITTAGSLVLVLDDDAVRRPRPMVVTDDGTLVVGEDAVGTSRILTVSPAGEVATLLGGGRRSTADACQDTTRSVEGPAQGSCLYTVGALALTADGALVFSDNTLVRRWDPEGTVQTLLGADPDAQRATWSQAVDDLQGRSPRRLNLGAVGAVAVSPSGALLVEAFESLWSLEGSNAVDTSTGTRAVLDPERRRLYIFDLDGHHLETQALPSRQRLWSFAYDDQGQLTDVIDAAGGVTTLQRDGRTVLITSPRGVPTTLTLNPDGFLGELDAAGSTWAMGYGPRGLLTELTLPDGEAHAYVYDEGRLVADRNPSDADITLTRGPLPDPEASGHRVTVEVTRDGEAQREVSTYDTARLPSGVTRYTFTPYGGGAVVTEVAPDRSSVTRYPDGSEVERVTAPDPQWLDASGVSVGTYTARLRMTTPSGRVATLEADKDATFADPGDPLSLTEVTTTWRLEGDLLSVERLDLTAGERTVTDPEGRARRWTLDDQGRVLSVTPDVAQVDPLEYRYDDQGRLSARQLGDFATQFAWDDGGVTVTDPLGRETRATWQAGLLTQVGSPGGRTVRYDYGADRRLSTLTLPSGAAIDLSWDGDGDPLTWTPRQGVGARTYLDGLDGRSGGVVLEGSGRRLEIDYDDQGRDEGNRAPRSTVAFQYPDGVLRDATAATWARVGDDGRAQTLAVTRDGVLDTEVVFSGVAQGAFAYVYDDTAQLTGWSLDDGAVQPMALDPSGAVVRDGDFTLERDGPARQVSRVAGDGFALEIDFDRLGRPTRRSLVVGGETVHALELTYDAPLRLERVTETVGGDVLVQALRYDADDQLEAALEGPSGDALEAAGAWSWDLDGDLERVGEEEVSWDARGALTAVGDTAYTVDDDGFVVALGEMALVYDVRGALLEVTLGDGAVIRYTYDALGRRTGRADDAGTTTWLYGDPTEVGRVTHERAPDGTWTRYYYDGSGFVYAMDRGRDRFYVATDLVGTPRAVFDDAGALVARLERGPFGRWRGEPGFALSIGFAGGLEDPATGLVRHWRRDYDPRSARWTSPDPALLAGGDVNVFRYAANNPALLRDPTGLAFCVGFSGYFGGGGGAKYCYGEGRHVVCTEAGVGFGMGAEFNEGALPDTSSRTANAEAGFGCGPAGVSGELVYDNDRDCVTNGNLKFDYGAGRLTGDLLSADQQPAFSTTAGAAPEVNGCSFSAKLATVKCETVPF